MAELEASVQLAGVDASVHVAADSGLCLEVKPFGKDGVRLCWKRPESIFGEVVAEVLSGEEWRKVAEDVSSEGASGVIVVRSLPQGMCPRSCPWRIRCGVAVSAMKAARRVAGSNRARQSNRQAREQVLEDDDVEFVYNLLQWYGTVVIDMRPEAPCRLAESLICPDAAALAALPFRDDALVIGNLPQDNAEIICGRVAKATYYFSPDAVPRLLSEFPCLAGEPSAKRRALPNIVCGRLVVGHQGHALTLPQWAETLSIVGVINLASNKVPSVLAAIENPQHYLEILHADGAPLHDVAGHLEGCRLLDVLPGVLDAVDAALASAPAGRVFIHCQQGRSRAASVATAQLLRWNPTWTLFDAMAFLARRRPEVELNFAYVEALEEFAADLGREPSLPRLQSELPAQLRGAGVARDWRDKSFDIEPLIVAG